MIYVITGGSGFIGKRLIQKLLSRPGAEVHFLIRNSSPERLKTLGDFWGAEASRAVPMPGDLTAPLCGVDAKTIEALRGRVDHFFHLGAIYDLAADPAQEMQVNIEGTRNALALADALGARRFHHMSSIAAAGLYEGVFREDMFEEAENLEHPYFASKHAAEKVLRTESKLPWRIYRPGLVVGDSRTGEMDKIDGPYYFFKLIQKLRGAAAALGADDRPRRRANQSRARGLRRLGGGFPRPQGRARRALLPSGRSRPAPRRRHFRPVRRRSPCAARHHAREHGPVRSAAAPARLRRSKR